MKKFIVLILVGLLVLVFGTTVFAQKKEEPKLDFGASGFINVISFYTQNVPPLNGGAKIFGAPATANYSTPDANAWNRTVSYMDQRMSLNFDARMGKELNGRLSFEIDSTHWGDYTGDRGKMGYWTTDRAAVEVKHVYIDVGLPYIGIDAPMTVRLGAQPLGIRPLVFLTNDGTGISGGIKVDPVMIQPMWYKALEGSDWKADDVDVYGLHINTKVDTFTIGGYGINYNMNTYPFNAATSDQQANMWWLGIYADGKSGPVDLNFDFVYDRGKVEQRGFRDVKYRGFVTKLKVDYPYEKYNLGVTGAYGSGTDMNKNPNPDGFADGKNTEVGSFVIPPGSENAPASNESVVLSMNAGSTGGIGWADCLNGNQMNRGLLGGLWFAKLYGSYKAAPWYKVTLQGFYIGDTTKHGNTFGNAVKDDGTLRDDKGIGWELDLINDIDIYKNLTWRIAAGVLLAGDAMDMKRTATTNAAMKNPWAITTKFQYSF